MFICINFQLFLSWIAIGNTLTMDKKFDIKNAKVLDKKDPLSIYRKEFNIPFFQNKESVYFTGHSLGLQPKAYNKYLNQEIDDWKKMGVEGHFHAQTPWFDYHKSLTHDSANLVGAQHHEVVTMNSLSVNLHLLLMSFYQPNAKKYKVLCEPHLFPSDLYVLQSQIQLKGFDFEDAIIYLPADSNGVVSDDDLYSTIEKYKDELALIFIGGVNYYTGQVFDMEEITKMGHRHNIIVGFDLAHAAGNVELKLHDWKVDFAAWCSYKYLNSGPGNVSTIFVHENQIQNNPFRLSGWWGHEVKNRFELQKKFQPINTAEGWQLSNASVFGMSIYRVSLQLFNDIGMSKLIQKRIKLTTYLEAAIDSFNQHSSHSRLRIITPGLPKDRGSQLSIFINNNGEVLYKALKESGVYVDFRPPNVIRMAPVPLYNSFEDVARFYKVLFTCI